MSDRDYLIILYDFYGELLTLKQQQYFEDYYFNNFTLSEISQNLNISRNAVHKSLKGICEKLIKYEEILKLYTKSMELKKIAQLVQDTSIRKKLEDFY